MIYPTILPKTNSNVEVFMAVWLRYFFEERKYVISNNVFHNE